MIERLELYVENYSKHYNITPDEVRQLALYREVKKYYEEEENEKSNYIFD